ncbi:MAG: PAS sensor protein [candidate division Zixibacteria bacterium RBG-1]|nr:MAG: PAS sensor protein [candidate division Zixibacteria bacterium RBG-1]
MQTQTKNHPDLALEQLRDKLKENERWFRTLDNQVRILERERQKLLALVNNTDAGYLVVDTSLKITWTNEAFVKRFGPDLHLSSILGAKCNQVLCNQSHICEVCPAPKTFISGGVVHYEVRLDLGGEPRQIYVTAMPIKSPEGKISEAFIMLQDITDLEVLRRSQDAVKNSEQQLRIVLETVGEGIVAIDSAGNILMVNQEIQNIFGYSKEELIGQKLQMLMPEKYRSAHAAGMKKYLGTGISRVLGKHLEFEGLKKDGSVFPVEVRITETRLGESLIFIGALRNITERKKAEEGLRSTLSLLTATLESTADGILVVDQEGKIVSFNRKFVEMWRIPNSVVASKDDNQALEYVLDQLQDPQGFLKKVRELYAHPEAESYDILEFKDDRVFERYSQPQRIAGRSVGRVWSFRDITESKLAEEALRQSKEQLLQSQKMEAIGRLAGGVAHDFNNLLTVIMGRCQLLLRKFGAEETLNRDINLILSTSERAALLTKQLLAFSRKQLLQPRVLDLNEVVSDMDKMLRRMIGEDIELVTVLAKNLGKVKADPGQVSQVILNLVVNARDAMPSGGKLTIETANVEIYQKNQHLHSGREAGSYVTLIVNDIGSGIEPETLPQIFEPFFTTKEKGQGTGLGLATVYGIVKQSGGHISVSSLPKQGSTFKVYLPKVEETVEPKARTSEKVKQKGALETILLVEDESDVRELIGDLLRENGFTVLEAGHSGEALEICQKFEKPIQLLLTDVVMPQMSGPELAKLLSQMRPEMKVLFMSGYTDTAVVNQGWLAPGTAFLQKPFTQEILVNKIREVLDHQPAGK